MESESAVKQQIIINNVLFYALIAGVVFFFIVAMIIKQNNNVSAVNDIDNIFIIAVPVFGLLMVFLSQFFYKKSLVNIDINDSLMQKLQSYRTLKIISWAMIEGACLFSLISFYITANYFYVIIFISLLLIFILQRPSKESFIVDFRLNSEERELVHKS